MLTKGLMIFLVNKVSYFASLFFHFSVVQLLGESTLQLLNELYSTWVKRLLLYDLSHLTHFLKSCIAWDHFSISYSLLCINLTIHLDTQKLGRHQSLITVWDVSKCKHMAFEPNQPQKLAHEWRIAQVNRSKPPVHSPNQCGTVTPPPRSSLIGTCTKGPKRKGPNSNTM